MAYNAAIFDLDGTLLNTLDDLAASTNAALAAHGMPGRTTDEVRQFVGNGIMNLIRRATPAGTSEDTQRAVFDTFCAHYADHALDATAPYPGIVALLDELRARGVKLAVVSNKGDFAVQELVDHFWKGQLDFAVGEREGIRRKPAPDTVLTALEALGVSADEAVYVGDSEVDVATAAASGLDCICVTWGFRSVQTLLEAGATTLVDTCDQLLDLIIN